MELLLLILLRTAVVLWLIANIVAIAIVVLGGSLRDMPSRSFTLFSRMCGKFLTYEALFLGGIIMLLPFYWMVVTSFKDGQTAASFPPIWTPSRVLTEARHPDTGEIVPVVPLETRRPDGQPIRVVPEANYTFQTIDDRGVRITREVPDLQAVFRIDPQLLEQRTILDLDFRNFRRAWYRPEETSRGAVNFLTYFFVSVFTSVIATTGALLTSALAAFAFARLVFWGKQVLFYVILATMMVPGQVLLIPNFLILSTLGLLDTYAALTVPWLASVFTIFLMRQFFLTIPEDLWDAARIDGSSRFRYLWQIVVPLSKPVFITAGIFDFLNNWNSLLWPLIVTSSPTKRTLMVGLQNLNDEAGSEFHILMAASCFAIVPIVIVFFFLQRFFIQGIARTGIK